MSSQIGDVRGSSFHRHTAQRDTTWQGEMGNFADVADQNYAAAEVGW
jgi:hypothetical protein